ncbi:MAG: universal stress protein [Lewinellaceae bacterium]|nr:universal stress protein [Lewinellaceae bacterium]
MKTILVPTDFSKCSANAFRYAMETAQRTGAEILAIHVVFPNEGVDNNVYNAFWIDEYFKQREKDLKDWVNRQKRGETFKKIPVRVQCFIGFPVQGIHAIAEKEKVDLVIMGTTGATGLKKVLLGSVAAGVIARTKKPVLIIPQKTSFREKVNAVFATDFRLRTDRHSLEMLHELPSLQKGKVHIVNIMDKPGSPDKSKENTLTAKLGTIKHDFHYLHDLEAVQAVFNFMESTDAEMLIAVAHEHSLFHRLFYDSMTRKLAQRVNVPMLVLHDIG